MEDSAVEEAGHREDAADDGADLREEGGEGLALLAHDDLRERSGWLLNAKRRDRDALAAKFPGCDFGQLQTLEDELWTEDLEPTAQTAARGYAFLRWLSEREEVEIAVVAHGGLFAYMLNECRPKVHAEGAPLGGTR